MAERSMPRRGEVIVFVFPGSDANKISRFIDLPFPGIENVNYIKRVIGLPGDRISMTDGILQINGRAAKQKLIGKTFFRDARCRQYDVVEYSERIGDVEHSIYRADVSYPSRFDEIVVPEKMLFVMGDNRDHSSDSRTWGFVPLENVKGLAITIFHSFDDCRYTPRSERIGMEIN
jgi:signal peptidase I